MRHVISSIIAVFALISISSCGTTKEVTYLQDLDQIEDNIIQLDKSIKIQPKDQLTITVSCQDKEFSAMFNLPVVTYQGNSEITGDGGASQRNLHYSVDEDGMIEFPILGKIHAAGLNRWELQNKIKQDIIKRKLLKDLVVTVEFANFKISVLGEVTNPGSYKINGDKVTILEAISLAKDLTIYGRRDQVYVIREENNERTTYKADLRSTNLFKSPVYYLQQNDIVYVQPNKVRAGQSNINENNLKSVSLWISVASLLSSVAVLVATIVDNKNN